MDYQKIYYSICERGKSERDLDYSEVHHIRPKCLGGSNDIDNLTRLTYREHYIAHWLLVKMYPKERGINYAFLCMLRKHSEGRILTSRMFDSIKRNYSRYKKFHCTLPNPGKSKKSREAARKRMLTDNPNKGGSTNHTARSIEVEYYDGKKEIYAYGKQLAEEKEISYSTVKRLIRYKCESKKHSIKSIKQIK